MMKKILTACAIAAASFVAAPAFAQGYIGAGFGSSKISGFDTGTISGGNTSKGLVKIYGGYQFTPNWGLEAQYSDLGRRDVTNAGVAAGSFSSSQFSLAGTGTLPLSSGFSLLGKLGASANRVNGSALIGSANSTSLLIGVGAAYNITPALSVRLEYEDFGTMAKIAANGSSVRANGYSLSLKYGF
jgi:OOP family OmpA-OmpF porin